jgi:putative peptide zinc metalloprotease protein
MSTYAADALVSVYPFVRQPDGEEIVIGRPDTATYLALPVDAVEMLDFLADGRTVGETQELYRAKYGEIPDMVDLLEYLEQKGFVRPVIHGAQAMAAISAVPISVPKAVRYHLANFPERLAQQIFSRPVLMVGGLVILLGAAAVAAEPWIIPGWNALFFSENMTLMRLGLMVLEFVTVMLHELAHLVAARSVGVSARFGVSTRMWVPVAETDMTGVWAVPRHKRYLPFLAGPMLDLVCASLLVLCFYADGHGWISLPYVVFRLGQAILFSYLLRLLWQCYFFVRTDFYYVIANLFNCKNLIVDTVGHLRNSLSQLFSRIKPIDQSKIPTAEMKVIRWFSLVWVAGRMAALVVLVTVTVPLMWRYLVQIIPALQHGYRAAPYLFVDAVVMGTIVFGYQSWGLWMWIRNLRNARRDA